MSCKCILARSLAGNICKLFLRCEKHRASSLAVLSCGWKLAHVFSNYLGHRIFLLEGTGGDHLVQSPNFTGEDTGGSWRGCLLKATHIRQGRTRAQSRISPSLVVMAGGYSNENQWL